MQQNYFPWNYIVNSGHKFYVVIDVLCAKHREWKRTETGVDLPKFWQVCLFTPFENQQGSVLTQDASVCKIWYDKDSSKHIWVMHDLSSRYINKHTYIYTYIQTVKRTYLPKCKFWQVINLFRTADTRSRYECQCEKEVTKQPHKCK